MRPSPRDPARTRGRERAVSQPLARDAQGPRDGGAAQAPPREGRRPWVWGRHELGQVASSSSREEKRQVRDPQACCMQITEIHPLHRGPQVKKSGNGKGSPEEVNADQGGSAAA